MRKAQCPLRIQSSRALVDPQKIDLDPDPDPDPDFNKNLRSDHDPFNNTFIGSIITSYGDKLPIYQ